MSTETATESAAVTEKSILERSQFAAHLAKYPTINSIAQIATRVPGVKSVAANASPVLATVRERTKPIADPIVRRAKPLLFRVDSLGDNALGQLDKYFPGLKTTHPSEIYENAQQRVGTVRENIEHAYDERVTKPISSVVGAAKNQYTRVYDSQVNDRVAPLNDRLEAVIDTYIPQCEGTHTAESINSANSNQLGRTVLLARVAAERAAPQIVAARDGVRKHIYSVYTSQLGESKGVPARAIAAAATIRYLGGEVWTKASKFVTGTVRPQVESKAAEIHKAAEARASEIRSQAEAKASDIQKAAEAKASEIHKAALELQRNAAAKATEIQRAAGARVQPYFTTVKDVTAEVKAGTDNAINEINAAAEEPISESVVAPVY